MSDAAIDRVVVVVPTAGVRPLGPLLERLVAQASTHHATVDVAVLDNGSRESATVSATADAHRVLRRHVAGRGVASVRNAAIDLLAERGADTLVFLDDDELPEPGWLDALTAVATRYAADVVLGPVPVAVPDHAPRWLGDGRVLRDVPDRADGPFDGYVNAGNTLIRKGILDRTGARFDPVYDSSGGEDIVFFAGLREAGAVVAWARDAVAFETQDPDRLTLGGYSRRLYAFGQRSVLVERATTPASSSAARIAPRRAYRILRGAGVGVGGVVTRRPERAARGLGDIAFGWGSLTALAGRRPNTYSS